MIENVHVEEGRYIASQVSGSRFVELPGADHFMWAGDSDRIVDEVESFLTGVSHRRDTDRLLTTVLFTDIVGSTELAARIGDQRWRELLERHHAVVRRELGMWRGREVDTAGDGFLATFDGPARAVRSAVSIREGLRELGLDVRAGIHTGEVEIAGDQVRGIAIHIGSRVAALASPGEVLVSSTVRDLVHGSGITFDDRGEHQLKGAPGRWQLFAVTAA